MELNLRFPKPDQVVVRLGDDETGALPFKNPLKLKDHQDLSWYVETYGAYSLGDPDDSEAARIKAKLLDWGHALFQAVFQHEQAQTQFQTFQAAVQQNRHLTLNTSQPSILALPWELLHDGQSHLFHQGIKLSRRLDEAQARPPLSIASKSKLHLLFVISRPQGAGFINPRAEAKAVLDALAEHAEGRVSAEFLHPANFRALQDRLQDTSKPTVDILHFDGHGAFDEASQTGYLLFENYRGQPEALRGNPQNLSAQDLGGLLRQHHIPLVILSACQSATQGEEPLGSVATGLLAAGIPAVLAMTHSVLVATAQALFGAFYRALAQGQTLGAALDHAREYLDGHPEKYPVRRGQDWVPLQLHDWFVPALYQSGEDLPLLASAFTVAPLEKGGLGGISNLPAEPKAGFHGRSLELWKIERGFALDTRRISISGFGGQGKTALALEAGRWLLRTGRFEAVAFVSYAGLKTLDPVAIALNTLGDVLGASFPTSADALAALQKTPTLIILDNLETLPTAALQELLDSAVEWSQVGDSRVLLTSRTADFQHAAYPVAGGLDYLRVSLSGLGSREYPNDALAWFGELIKRPPEFACGLSVPTREELVGLFDKVGFHPLSIHILAAQLKTRRVEELGERLEKVLLDSSSITCLQQSLEQLTQDMRTMLPRISLFQGGAWESEILAISGISEIEWTKLVHQLESVALVEVCKQEGVDWPFLRFHPAFSVYFLQELTIDEKTRLDSIYRERYHVLARLLQHDDHNIPSIVRTIAWQELPNLVWAVKSALTLNDAEAVEFAMNVNYFLDIFGLRQESEQVTALVHSRATKIGSPAWVLAQFIHSKQLLDSGYIAEAIHLLETAFPHIDRAATYERAVAFGCLGQCYLAKGQPQQSIALQQEALAILRVLNQTYNVKLNIGIRQTGLADGLVELGQPEKARKTYKEALTIFQELKDLAGQASVLNQLGILAWRQLNTAEAIDCYTKSINLFQMDTPHVFNGKLALYQPMQEPIAKASILHNLGIIYQDQQRWDEAEHHFREAALIQESHGNLKSAIKSWNHLGIVSQFLGKTELANQWYKKVIEAEKQNGGNSLELALHLTNLAELLRHQPENLAEARDLAEKALFIKKSMDSGSVEIWKTYGLLAEIADVEANAAKDSGEQRKWRQTAINYRRLALDARRAFPGSRVILENCANLIILTVSVCGNFFTENRSLPWYHRLWRRPITVGDTHHIEAKARLKEWQAELRHESLYSAQLADALDRLLAGERDPNILCSDLHYDSALIMLTILNGLENPVSLEWLIPYLR